MLPLVLFADAAPEPPPAAFVQDGSHGRVEGDVSLVLGVGATFNPRAPRGTIDFRARYVDTIGLFGTYEDALGGDSDPRRVIAFGLELRPLFLGRWLQGAESGVARWDLFVDSIGLELGAVFTEPVGGTFVSRPGVQASLGLEFPVLPSANGLWLGVRGGARWSDGVLSGGAIDSPNDRSLFLSVTVAWHQFFGAHVVDVRDRAPR